jgi:hypothetical protein
MSTHRYIADGEAGDRRLPLGAHQGTRQQIQVVNGDAWILVTGCDCDTYRAGPICICPACQEARKVLGKRC